MTWDELSRRVQKEASDKGIYDYIIAIAIPTPRTYSIPHSKTLLFLYIWSACDIEDTSKFPPKFFCELHISVCLSFRHKSDWKKSDVNILSLPADMFVLLRPWRLSKKSHWWVGRSDSTLHRAFPWHQKKYLSCSARKTESARARFPDRICQSAAEVPVSALLEGAACAGQWTTRWVTLADEQTLLYIATCRPCEREKDMSSMPD